MESEFWKTENLLFAVMLTTLLYCGGMYFLLLPAYLERLRRPRSITRLGVVLHRRTNLYTLIFIFSPLLFLPVLASTLFWLLLSIFSVFMLMVMAPFYWLFSKLPFNENFSLIRPWKRLGRRMMKHSRKLLLWLLGEGTLQKMQPLQDQARQSH
ncbi:MAG: hypothetical protein DDG60_01475 [Anaerolineae bacterium]|nr:MAG: hypothetical protein DDG60_01475 [Anaerolineae bacterium]